MKTINNTAQDNKYLYYDGLIHLQLHMVVQISNQIELAQAAITLQI